MKIHSESQTAPNGRVLQLLTGIVCMVMIANLQYGWNLFVEPMSKAQHWSRTEIAGA